MIEKNTDINAVSFIHQTFVSKSTFLSTATPKRRYVEIIDLIDPYNSKRMFVKEWDKKPKDVGGQNTVG